MAKTYGVTLDIGDISMMFGMDCVFALIYVEWMAINDNYITFDLCS